MALPLLLSDLLNQILIASIRPIVLVLLAKLNEFMSFFQKNTHLKIFVS